MIKNNIVKIILLASVSSIAISDEISYYVAPQIGFYHYKEPDLKVYTGDLIDVNFKGPLLGAELGLKKQFNNGLMFLADSRIAVTLDQYTAEGQGASAGVVDDVPSYIFDISPKIGFTLPISNVKLTPFIGLGYRFLYNDFGNTVSKPYKGQGGGLHGYTRISNYVYASLGVDFSTTFANDDWGLSGRVEYNWFLYGVQHSDFSDFSGYNTIFKNEQHGGYGIESHILVTKSIDKNFTIGFGPYVKYWHIQDSDLEINSIGTTGVIEPENTTLDIGLELRLLF